MKPENITALRGSRAGEIAYVFGSGEQLDALDPSQFDGLTITLNRVPLCWPLRPTFAVTKYHRDALELIAAGHTVVAPRGDRGHNAEGDWRALAAAYVYEHLDMLSGLVWRWPENEGWLMVGPTVQMTALHFAAELGAARIECFGCAGEGHVAGYYSEDERSAYQRAWLRSIREPMQRFIGELTSRYPLAVVYH